MASPDDLGAYLRAWRDRLAPENVGLPATARRRAPGLRRQELAQLAGLSVEYLARLEQGRATNPSGPVLEPLARALRLTDAERAHLFRLAGQSEPTAGSMRRHLTPSVQRILDRLGDVPVTVSDLAWTVVSCNPLSEALLGSPRDAEGRMRNVARDHFLGLDERDVRHAQGEEDFGAAIVASLHDALGRFGSDASLRALVDELLEASDEFRALWAARPVAPSLSARKVIHHPEVGPVWVDCDVLHVEGSDLVITVYTTPPGSPDARALELLSALGRQTFAA